MLTIALSYATQEETSFHQFFECPFNQTNWNTIPINWNLNLRPLDMVTEAENHLAATYSVTSC